VPAEQLDRLHIHLDVAGTLTPIPDATLAVILQESKAWQGDDDEAVTESDHRTMSVNEKEKGQARMSLALGGEPATLLTLFS
jgi:hypothetical protein